METTSTALGKYREDNRGGKVDGKKMWPNIPQKPDDGSQSPMLGTMASSVAAIHFTNISISPDAGKFSTGKLPTHQC